MNFRYSEELLAEVDLYSRRSSNGFTELLVLRKQHTELRMYKESTHGRPHFHIEYKKEFGASYALDTFERLAGQMPRRYEDAILREARDRHDELLKTWAQLNGPVQCIAPEGGR